MLSFGVAIPASVPQRSEIPEGLMNYPVLQKKWEYNETLPGLFLDVKQAYDSVRRKVFYDIVI
jgi:hypothetical protein